MVSQTGRTRRAAPQEAAAQLPRTIFRDLRSQDTISTLREWSRGETIDVRLYRGASHRARDSAVVLHDTELAEASPHSPESIKGSDTCSLHPNSAIDHATSELDSPPGDASEASEGADSGYNTPNPSISTADAVKSESMLSSSSTAPTPSLSYGSSTSSTLSVESSASRKYVVQGTQYIDPETQELASVASDTSQRFSRTTFPHTLPVGRLVCPLWFLDCKFKTDHEGEWCTHAAAHFRGHPLPQIAFCTICGASYTTPPGISTNDGVRGAWAQKMSCLQAHFVAGLTFERDPPDFKLFKYLWSKRIIDIPDYQELVNNYYLAHGPRYYATFHGPARLRGENPLRGRDGRRRQN